MLQPINLKRLYQLKSAVCASTKLENNTLHTFRNAAHRRLQLHSHRLAVNFTLKLDHMGFGDHVRWLIIREARCTQPPALATRAFKPSSSSAPVIPSEYSHPPSRDSNRHGSLDPDCRPHTWYQSVSTLPRAASPHYRNVGC